MNYPSPPALPSSDASSPSSAASPTPGLSRRRLLIGGASAAAVPWMAPAHAEAPMNQMPVLRHADAPISIELSVNGQNHRLSVDARTTLLDALREELGLTGSKKGCDHGQCGACTLHVGGRRVLSCLVLAVSVREPVTTVEGLSEVDGALHPMQQAFIDQDAFQCGYCTPGQIMSAIACVREGHAGSDFEIREYMSGNLCRCAAYPHILAAVKQAKPQIKEG
jgi:xanthine dehydrogenase YagT iron-sulfur-binding subunit